MSNNTKQSGLSSLARAAVQGGVSPQLLAELGGRGRGALLSGREARRNQVDRALPPSTKQHPRIAIVGSVDFYQKDSPALCDAIGTALAQRLPRACILTGANAVTQERLSRAFYDEMAKAAAEKGQRAIAGTDRTSCSPLVFHLAPEGYDCDWGFGTCLEAGYDMDERRYILATLADVCLVVEGGPGTADEMYQAEQAGKVVVPLGRTGGAAGGMFDAPRPKCPSGVPATTWGLLHDEKASIEDTLQAVLSILEAVCGG